MKEAEIIKKPKLTMKERKFVNAKLKGMTNRKAYIDAYDVKPTTKLSTIDPEASRTAKKPQVQQAIERALEANEMTPEFAVMELKKIVEQDKELGAKRLAIKDVLELHGYKAVTPKMSFNIDKGFFSNSRQNEGQ